MTDCKNKTELEKAREDWQSCQCDTCKQMPDCEKLCDFIRLLVAVHKEQADEISDIEEKHRMQMAAISSALNGNYRKGEAIHPDYESCTLNDALECREKIERLKGALERLKERSILL